MKQKHFVDIEVARLADDEFKTNNVSAFEVGDTIQVSEKIDGANASIAWDEENKRLAAFSRKQELSTANTLNGFYDYVRTLPLSVYDWFENRQNYVFFGEWSIGCNKIKDYDEKYKHTWITYDVFDKDKGQYLPQEKVKEYAKYLGFNYIHELYYGPFTSWDDIKKYLHENTYGGTQEGCIIKDQSKLDNTDVRTPIYLKIVNDSFKEKMKTRVKREKSADELAEEQRCQTLVDSIVTRRRVEKGIEKLRDEGALPEKLLPTNMKLIAKCLPKYIYEDCLKEEREIVESVGNGFSKMCSSAVMKLAREIVIGG